MLELIVLQVQVDGNQSYHNSRLRSLYSEPMQKAKTLQPTGRQWPMFGQLLSALKHYVYSPA